MSTFPVSMAAQKSLRCRSTQPTSPAVMATRQPLARAWLIAARMTSKAPGISHRYPSMTSMRDRVMAVLEPSDSCSCSWLPRYDSIVLLASGVVSTMTVPGSTRQMSQALMSSCPEIWCQLAYQNSSGVQLSSTSAAAAMPHDGQATGFEMPAT